uniref:Fatty acyl-CoA reductase n=1 Tax=Oryza rufipogon TaxID=4529 RepID=A0A0E0PMM2_ORYRU
METGGNSGAFQRQDYTHHRRYWLPGKMCQFHSWYQCKVLVEKILRVQPEVRKLYLLVRAPDAIAAEERVLTEVVGNGLFDVLREQYGAGFHSFIKEKIYALPGDVTHENFGLESYDILQLSQKVDIIVNGAATTNFMERYDVALATNTTGVVHLCQFAKQCDNLKMVLHVSTAYVAGEQAGQIFEKPFQMGTALRLDYQLDIEAELQLVDKIKSELGINSDSKLEKITMRKLGLERTIDVIFVAYNDQTLPCFIFDGSVIFDLIPGDMVINAMMAAINSQWNKQAQVIYHVTSSHQNPLPLSLIEESLYKYFHKNPRTSKDGKTIQNEKILTFNRLVYFQAYMILRYKVPLEMMRAANVLLGGIYTKNYYELNRGYNILMTVAKLYAPYVFFKGCAVLVEKILRVQPEVRKLYLLVRAPDATAAEERVLAEVVGKGLFDVLRKQHSAAFYSFIKKKICPLAGDVMHENFGLGSSEILRLSQEVDIIVNGAATTNFMERYDVALATNTEGVVHLCHFAKQCDNLKMLLHVSTAYVAGEQAGLLLEKPFQICEALRQGYTLDVEAEVQLVDRIKSKLRIKSSIDNKLEKTTMKKLGLKRNIIT